MILASAGMRACASKLSTTSTASPAVDEVRTSAGLVMSAAATPVSATGAGNASTPVTPSLRNVLSETESEPTVSGWTRLLMVIWHVAPPAASVAPPARVSVSVPSTLSCESSTVSEPSIAPPIAAVTAADCCMSERESVMTTIAPAVRSLTRSFDFDRASQFEHSK